MSTALLKNNSEEALEGTSLMRAGYTEYNPAILDLTELEQIKPSPQWTWLIFTLGEKKWLPSRFTDPLYGRDILDTQLRKGAASAPGIERVREITKNWPSLTNLLIEDRNNE